ncbi:MAG: C-GCAxxG-C-C family protein [Oscillospiraceae bacterium]|nr:C-GCAxxG-C-C family protein [Oscillospiraceae bacterium]
MTRQEKAGELFLEGFNCSQSVFTAFCDRFGLNEETAKRISAGLGGGVGRMREVCGAVSAAAMVLGSLRAGVTGDDKESKKENYDLVQEFARRFEAIHSTVICREMLKRPASLQEGTLPENRTPEYYKNRPCLKVVEDAAGILEEMIGEYEKK